MAKKVAKLKKLVPTSLLQKLADASDEDRDSVTAEVERARAKRMRKMAKRGYQLEAVIGEGHGVFTRGQAVGTIRLVERSATDQLRASAG